MAPAIVRQFRQTRNPLSLSLHQITFMSTLPWVTTVLGLSDMLMSFYLEQTIYHYTYSEKQSYWSGVVAQPVISALWKLRQEDCIKSEATLVYSQFKASQSYVRLSIKKENY